MKILLLIVKKTPVLSVFFRLPIPLFYIKELIRTDIGLSPFLKMIQRQAALNGYRLVSVHVGEFGDDGEAVRCARMYREKDGETICIKEEPNGTISVIYDI